jgi:hypothetical protein
MPEHEEFKLVSKYDDIRLKILPGDETLVHFERFILNHRVILII